MVKAAAKMTKDVRMIIIDFWFIFALKLLFIASIVCLDIAVTRISCYCCLVSCVTCVCR
jgi:hypothetical protein